MQKIISNSIFCVGLLMFGYGLNYTFAIKAIGVVLIIVGIALDPKIWQYFKQRNNRK